MLRTLLALSLAAAAAATLAAPAAAQVSGATYKVSAYGIQRWASSGKVDFQRSECSGSRGTESTSIVTRFKTKRPAKMRLTNLGGAYVLVPLGNADWTVTGSVEARMERSGVGASCSDLNPDGSIKWTPWTPADDSCLSGKLAPLDASLRYASQELAFSTSDNDDVLLAPLTPGACGPYSDSQLGIYQAKARVPLSRIRGTADEPIVLRYRDKRSESTATGSSKTKISTTVYVTFTRVGRSPSSASTARMSRTARTVPRAVPVTFDRPSRGR